MAILPPPPGGYYREPLPVSTNDRTSPQTSPYHMPDRTLTVQGLPFSNRNTPRIRLVGQWLRAAGFKPRDRVTVTVTRNKLVIVPAPPQEG